MQTAGTITLLPRLGEAGRGLRWHVPYNPMHGGSGGNGSVANLSNGQSSTSGSNWGNGHGSFAVDSKLGISWAELQKLKAKTDAKRKSEDQNTQNSNILSDWADTRLYNLRSQDAAVLLAYNFAFGLAVVSATGQVEAIASIMDIAGKATTLIVFADELWDYSEISEPTGADNARMIISTANVVAAGIPGGGVISAGISLLILNGSMDPLFNLFNKP